MSSASQTTQDTPTSSPAVDKQSIDKKKLKVLKMALKDEREARIHLEKELEAAIDKLDYTQSQIVEKDKKYLDLYNEHMELQETVASEMKGLKNSGEKKVKPPLLVAQNSNPISSKLDQIFGKSEKDKANLQIQTQNKELEDLVKIKEEQIKELQLKLDDFESQVLKMQMLFDKKLKEMNDEKKQLLGEIAEKEADLEQAKADAQTHLQQKVEEYEEQIRVINEEKDQLLQQRNKEMDTNLKIEERVDEKNNRIIELERDLQRKADEAQLQKEVLDSMGGSIMKYENENRENKIKIQALESQLAEYELQTSLGAKYQAKMILSKGIIPFSFAFSLEEEVYYLYIESKEKQSKVRMDQVESIQEKGNKIQIKYSLIEANTILPIEKTETFEQVTNAAKFMKTYAAIKKKLQLNAVKQNRRPTTLNLDEATDKILMRQQSSPFEKFLKKL